MKDKILSDMFKRYDFLKKIPTSFRDNMTDNYNQWKDIIMNKTKNWKDEDMRWVCARLEEEVKTLPGVSDFFDIYKRITIAGAGNKEKDEELFEENYGSIYTGYATTLFEKFLVKMYFPKRIGKDGKPAYRGSVKECDWEGRIKLQKSEDREYIAQQLGLYFAEIINNGINDKIKKECIEMKKIGIPIAKGLDINEAVKPLRIINALPEDIREFAKEAYTQGLNIESLPEKLPETVEYEENDIPF